MNRRSSRGAWAIAVVGLAVFGWATVGLSGAGAASSASHGPTNGPAAGPTSTPTPTAVVPSGPSLPPNLVPRLAYHGPTPAHVPPAWGGASMPPGAPVPQTPAGMSSAQFLQQWAGSSGYPQIHGTCAGKWPSLGQSAYTNQCVGHDEPAINPFSNLPGSGGNVTWNVALPVGTAPDHMQADLYIAIWFGMDLYDPFGYNGQCFLELQMYPDTNGAGQLQFNTWSAFTVAWQIELATGFEDPCIAAPMLESDHVTPLQMSAGDHLRVTMTGWVGSKTGERLAVDDLTSGVTSSLVLYNTTGHYPLDPAYVANNVEDSLPWSPGGDLPVAFSFESGHTVDNPGNNTFGGCSSGAPPANPLDPGAPCGSYNPRSWANDTKVPWRIYPVTFFHGATRVTAAQYGFEQDFGGMAWIDALSGGTCDARDGSAYCSYPWYSYSASEHAFNFGATDYTGTSQDFGQYGEYDDTLVTDSSGLNFYPVKNFTWSDPSGYALTLNIQGGGAVHFLDHMVSATTTLSALPPGAYSLNARPAAGMYFQGYSTSGGVSVDTHASGFSGLTLSGAGTLNAHFGPTAPAASPITFVNAGGPGRVTVVPGFAFPLHALYPSAGLGFSLVPSFTSTATTVGNGAVLHLRPGIYSLLADPAPGFNFTGWASSSPGAYLFTPASNYTWVNVTGPAATITANYAKDPSLVTVWFATYPAQGGEILFDGHVYLNGGFVTVRVGTHAIQALPFPAYSFVSWGPGLMGTINDFSSSTEVVAQATNIYVSAAFHSTPRLTDGARHGAFAVNGVRLAAPRTFSQVGDLTYQLEALPNPGYVFSGWSVDRPLALWVADVTAAITSFQLNGTATLTPHFVPSGTPGSKVSFSANGGTVRFNDLHSFSGHGSLASVAHGTYYLSESAAPGYAFAGWTTSGRVAVATTYVLEASTRADIENFAGPFVPFYSLLVSGSGHVTATFVPVSHPVTFIDFPLDPSSYLTIVGVHGTVTVIGGASVNLASGSYLVTYHGPLTKLHWFATSNLTVFSPHAATTSVHVAGSGAIYLVGEPAHGGGHGAARAGAPSAGPPSPTGRASRGLERMKPSSS